MGRGFFITGTDTGIGKTTVTIALMNAFKKQGYNVSGMKPIASGATRKNGHLRNEDAELISQACSKPTDYEQINPVVFELPVAPHIAADQLKQKIDIDLITTHYQQQLANNDFVFVEGVGGWQVPISSDLSMVDLVSMLNLPVILVVGFKLGCINHAILTADKIRSDGLSLCGWISNYLDEEYLFAEETKQTLIQRITAPYFAHLPFNQCATTENALQCLDTTLLMSQV